MLQPGWPGEHRLVEARLGRHLLPRGPARAGAEERAHLCGVGHERADLVRVVLFGVRRHPDAREHLRVLDPRTRRRPLRRPLAGASDRRQLLLLRHDPCRVRAGPQRDQVLVEDKGRRHAIAQLGGGRRLVAPRAHGRLGRLVQDGGLEVVGGQILRPLLEELRVVLLEARAALDLAVERERPAHQVGPHEHEHPEPARRERLRVRHELAVVAREAHEDHGEGCAHLAVEPVHELRGLRIVELLRAVCVHAAQPPDRVAEGVGARAAMVGDHEQCLLRLRRGIGC